MTQGKGEELIESSGHGLGHPVTHRCKRAHESKCLSAFGLPTPSAVPMPSDKAAAADLGKVYLGWVQVVRKYDDIDS